MMNKSLLALSALFGLTFAVTPTSAQNAKDDAFQLNQFASKESTKFSSVFFNSSMTPELVKPDKSSFEFEAGAFYLRRKINATTYVFYKGKVEPKNFGKLNALDLKGKTPKDLLFKKLYRSDKKKAFEDELDVYFDASGIYFEATPNLYVKDNGKWIQLPKSKQLSASLTLNTRPDKAEVRDENENLLGNTPFVSNGLKGGFQSFYLTKEGYFPLCLGVDVKSSVAPSISADLMIKKSSDDLPKSFNLYSVAKDSSHPYLDSIEQILRSKLEEDYSKVQFMDSLFTKSYYQPILWDAAWSNELKSPYQKYLDLFTKTRKAAFSYYAKPWLDQIEDMESNLKMIADTREQKQSQNILIKAKAKLVDVQTNDANSLKLKMELANPEKWLQAKWEGIVIADSSSKKKIDSLFKKQLEFEVGVNSQDWPVSYVGLDGQRYYRYYRLKTPEWALAKQPLKLAGKYSFSAAMMALPEVLRFVRADSMAAIDAMNQKLEDEVKHQKSLKDEEERERLRLDQLLRGKIVELASGEFKFKGKSVTLSPFAIQTTEVTQEHFQRLNQGKEIVNPFAGAYKPVVNISWNQAREFCQTIGGDLPTEAQWEYAARAGTNSYYYWGERLLKGEGVSPEPWAVFNDGVAKGPSDVASRRANSWGLYDVAGNVQEWVYDADDWWNTSIFISRVDPKGPAHFMADDRVIKGGGWKSNRRDLEHAKADREDPRYWSNDVGFRCAFPTQMKQSIPELKAKLKSLTTPNDK